MVIFKPDLERIYSVSISPVAHHVLSGAVMAGCAKCILGVKYSLTLKVCTDCCGSIFGFSSITTKTKWENSLGTHRRLTSSHSRKILGITGIERGGI
jgi:hypothetical protein